MVQASKPSSLWTMKNRTSGQSLASHAKLKKVHSNETRRFANDCESQEKTFYSTITSQTNRSAETNNLANHLKRRWQHDDKIPKLTGIGGFRLSDKTSTQSDNATGVWQNTRLLLQAFKDEDRQRGPKEDRGTLGKTRALGWGIPMQFWASLRSW